MSKYQERKQRSSHLTDAQMTEQEIIQSYNDTNYEHVATIVHAFCNLYTDRWNDIYFYRGIRKQMIQQVCELISTARDSDTLSEMNTMEGTDELKPLRRKGQ